MLPDDEVMRLPRRATGLVIAAWLLCVAGPGRASEEVDAWKATCERAKEVPLPAADQPDAATREALKGCHSEELFYGIGRPSDPTKARQCAFVERAAGDGEVFGGSAILMSIYATGLGAAQNLDLALRFVCEVEGAPAEIEGRMAHLEKVKHAQGSKRGGKIEFDLCDDVTSGFMMGHCAAHQQRMEAAKRDKRYAARVSKWTAAEKAAFQKLRAAASEFIQARSANEVDLGGTARAALQIEEEESLESAFDKILDELDRGALRPATDAELVDVDRKLNASYKLVMKAASPTDWGTVTKEGIREAERKWPKYRDAWAAFVKVKYPKVDPVSVKVRVTRERTDNLDAFAPADATAK